MMVNYAKVHSFHKQKVEHQSRGLTEDRRRGGQNQSWFSVHLIAFGTKRTPWSVFSAFRVDMKRIWPSSRMSADSASLQRMNINIRCWLISQCWGNENTRKEMLLLVMCMWLSQVRTPQIKTTTTSTQMIYSIMIYWIIIILIFFCFNRNGAWWNFYLKNIYSVTTSVERRRRREGKKKKRPQSFRASYKALNTIKTDGSPVAFLK